MVLQPTPRILRRAVFTDQLVAYLKANITAPVVVGDGEAPLGNIAGWTGTQAGQGTFIPYVVVMTGSGLPIPGMPETLTKRNESAWRLNYQISAAGGTRSQVDFAADAARVLLSVLHHQVYNVGQANAPWKVLKSDYVSLGGISRNDATDPPIYELTDIVEIWLERF